MKKIFLSLIAAALLIAVPAIANTVLWSSSSGDISFPISPTTIDGMTIGGTTPAAASVTTLSASGTVSGAGFTALFASPPAIGGTAPATAAVTTLSTTGLATLASTKVDTGTKTATASGGAATLAKNAGVITSEALSTAAGATYTLTLTNTTIAAADQVMASVSLGSATTGMPAITTVTPGAGSVVIVVQNIHASAALNGTIKIAFVTFKN